MTKADMAKQIATGTGLTRTDVSRVMEGVLEAIGGALEQGERIEIRGFGVFKVVERSPRKARNPRTGEAIALSGRRVPVFKPSKLLRARVDQHEGF